MEQVDSTNGTGTPADEETLLVLDVPPGQRADTRLDVYLTHFLPNATRSKVQRGIKEGRVLVNTHPAKASYLVQPGDRIACRLPRPPRMEARPEAIPLDIVFEDAFLIVVNKPAGMVVHPAYGNRTGTLVNALLHHVGGGPLLFDEAEAGDEGEEDPDAEGPGAGPGLSGVQAAPRFPGDPVIRPGIVHRLDKDTSGLLVTAKDDATHAHLARQFMTRTIRRTYRALVWGVPEAPEGRIEAPIGRDPRDRKRMAVVDAARGKHAVTHYRTMEAHACTALVEFRLETGRTHQIRVHARHLGHPVFGDAAYGGRQLRFGAGASFRRAFFNRLLAAFHRQALHAHTLGFRHPHTGEELDFSAPLPPDLQHLLDQLRAGRSG